MIALAERTSDVPSREEANAVLMYRRNGGSHYAGSNDISFCSKFDVLMRKFYVRSPRNLSGYRLWYMKELPALHYSLVHEDQPSSQSLIHMRTSPQFGRFDYRENIYVGQILYIYEGLGIGTMGRVTSIEREDAEQYIATCESVDSITDPDTPFTQGVDDTSKYVLLPWFPETYYPYLAMEGASHFTMHDGAQLLVPEKEEHKAKFQDFISPYDPSHAKSIIPNFPSDLGLEY